MDGEERLSDSVQSTTSAAHASDDTETVIGFSYGTDGADPGVYFTPWQVVSHVM